MTGGGATGSFAGIAAPALDSTFAVGAEPLAGFVLASGAGHGVSPLDFCAEKRHNEVGSGLWVTPRFGLAPPAARTADGALCVSYVLGWWFDRDLYGVTGSECDLDADYHAGFILPESPVDAGLSYLTPKSFLDLLGTLNFTFNAQRFSDTGAILAHSFSRFADCLLYDDNALSNRFLYVAFPYIGSLAVAPGEFLYFAALFQSAHDCGQGSQWIRLSAKIESPLRHQFFEIGNRHSGEVVIAFGENEGGSSRAGYTGRLATFVCVYQSFDLVGVFFKKITQDADRLFELGDSGVAFVALCDGPRKLRLSLCKCPSVTVLGHNACLSRKGA